MSIQALGWAFDQKEISSGKKFVLIALANYAGDTGLAYPSVHTICELTQQHDETVRKALADLVTEKVIKDTGKRVGATQQVKVYRLPEATWKMKTPENRSLTEGDVKAPRKPRQRPGKDPEKAGANLKPETVNQEPGIGASALPVTPAFPAEAEQWNAACDGKLSKVLGVGKTRMVHLKARREDPFWVANYGAALVRILASDFLTGKNDRGWKATFDWIVERPDAVYKVMEGKYDGPTKAAIKLW
jgi:hypothetical protein